MDQTSKMYSQAFSFGGFHLSLLSWPIQGNCQSRGESTGLPSLHRELRLSVNCQDSYHGRLLFWKNAQVGASRETGELLAFYGHKLSVHHF